MLRFLCLLLLTLGAALVTIAPPSLAPAGALQAQAAPKAEAKPAAHDLLIGVQEFAKSGTPGALNLWGDAQALIAGESSGVMRAMVAVTKAEKGKILALGHPGYLGAPKANSGQQQLLTNFLRERLKTEAKPTIVGGAKGLSELAKTMGWRFIDGGTQWHRHLDAAQVLVLAPGAEGTADQLTAVKKFVETGGYVAISFAGWIFTQHWAKGQDLARDSWVNQLTMPYGISFGESYIDSIIAPTSDRVEASGLAYLNADLCFAGLKDLIKPGERTDKTHMGHAFKAMGSICEEALRFSPLDGSGFAAKVALELPTRPEVTKNDPVTYSTPLKRLGVVLWLRRNALTPVDLRPSAPSVQAFPGIVDAKASRADGYFAVDLNREGWLSTGFYAPPGEIVTLTIPKEAQDLGLKVRIGANKDSLYGHRDTWFRYPEISEVHDVSGVMMRLNNPFGGLIYIENPKARAGVSLSFGLRGAARAPYFVLGETSDKDWQDTIRAYPAPWAELACDKVILTVPAHLIRSLDAPTALMRFWDRTRDYYAELSGKPLNPRPERMVVDVQISNGYMHAGYPIMMQTYGEADKHCVDAEILTKSPSQYAWGLWHELGHNHQEKDWTFSNTTEVTVNLFSLYVIERITGKSEVMTHRGAEARLESYFRDHLTWHDWGSKPFEGLLMYEIIIKEFGWDVIKKTFAEYRDLKDSERPKNDDEKRDQWLMRLSKQVGYDLGPHFEAFGVETSAAAKAEAAKLRPWMSKEVALLLKKYPRE